MSDETRKLLGGYATGTLTPEEKDILFAAALQDQELFEALHDEESLRLVLEDPAARAKVLQATESPEFTIASGLREWWERPRGKVLATLLAVAVVMMSFRTWQDRTPEPFREERSVAEAPKQTAPPARPEPRPSETAVARKPAAPLKQQQELEAPSVEGLVSAEPQMVATAPPAPPPPAPKAASTPAGLRWILERRTADGQVGDATPETEFASGDVVRIRVQSPIEGTLAIVRGAGQPVFATRVTAGQVVTLPQAIAFADAAEQRLTATVLPVMLTPSSLTRFRDGEAAALRQELPKPLLESQIILRRKE